MVQQALKHPPIDWRHQAVWQAHNELRQLTLRRAGRKSLARGLLPNYFQRVGCINEPQLSFVPGFSIAIVGIRLVLRNRAQSDVRCAGIAPIFVIRNDFVGSSSRIFPRLVQLRKSRNRQPVDRPAQHASDDVSCVEVVGGTIRSHSGEFSRRQCAGLHDMVAAGRHLFDTDAIIDCARSRARPRNPLQPSASADESFRRCLAAAGPCGYRDPATGQQ